ncbi:hypothetical protein AMECASPLE_007663 [Ameca splendens]|uniref:C2H2-type domain-containing protein n=1 Tax=Ameca splendens TaxID=208324 RepID=A0ABV0XNP5_9TELE
MTVPQTKGKKNAYSNSAQKMTCPFCPRVFPWMSSLQRHMLTHTGCSPPAGQQEPETIDQADQQGAPETKGAAGKQPHPSSKAENTDDDDCLSNKSLDLNFGKKLIDFKLSTSSSSSTPQEEQPSSSPSSAPSTSSAPQEAPEVSEDQEKAAPSCSSTSSPATKQQPEYKHVCRVCTKTFRYATTLARHERAHLSEETQTTMEEAPSPAKDEEVTESKTAEQEDTEKEAEMEEDEGGDRGGESDGGESGESEEEEKEKEERSDEEASEPKNMEGQEAVGGRVDKRKKICTECGKRFWSLQDLTRHMRSHTGRAHLDPAHQQVLYRGRDRLRL